MRNAYIDLVRDALQRNPDGKLSSYHPAHYVRYAYEFHCLERGRKPPTVEIQHVVRRARPICLEYRHAALAQSEESKGK